MYTSTEEPDEDLEEEDEEASEMEYLMSLQESMLTRAMTGGSSQKLTTVKHELIFLLR